MFFLSSQAYGDQWQSLCGSEVARKIKQLEVEERGHVLALLELLGTALKLNSWKSWGGGTCPIAGDTNEYRDSARQTS